MKMSLKLKVAVFVALIIITISSIITYFFITSQNRRIEKELISKGFTLNYMLSKAVQEGLAREDLDLIKQAYFIVKAEDVLLVQIYTSRWDVIDAYPVDARHITDVPHDIIAHFEESESPIYRKVSNGYEFYNLVTYQAAEDMPPVAIGFNRMVVSSLQMQKESAKIFYLNIIFAVVFTVLSIFAVNLLVSRLIMKPIFRLQRDVSIFKKGIMPDMPLNYEQDEIGELHREFNEMSHVIKERQDSLNKLNADLRDEIIAHKRAEDQLRKLSIAVEQSPVSIIITDTAGNIEYVNPKFSAVTGYDPEMVIGKNPRILKSGDTASEEYEQLWKSITNGEEWRGTFHNKKKDGSLYWEFAVISPVKNEDGDITNFIAVKEDITERKRLEESLNKAQRMESIGILAGGIAHDFNNMLQGILGYASLLKMKLTDTDPLISKAIEVIEKSALKSADLTKQLLGFARGGKYIVKPVSLNAVAENILQIISRTFDKTIDISSKLQDDLWLVEADQSQIENVLLNLCLNAKDAMPSGGALYIETSNQEHTDTDTLFPWADSEKYVAITVRDTGSGIKEDIKDRVFEPFFSTKEKGKGTGMGLAMAYGVIKSHGGYITVDSEVGKGAAFTVYLPATDKQMIDEKKDFHGIKRGKGTILLVDDEEIVRNVGRGILEHAGFSIIEASDGRNAVDIYSRKKDEIDGVILDIIMPKMGGKETLEGLKQINPNVKVLVASGYSLQGTAREMIDAGAKDFIQKPFNYNDIVDKVNLLLEQ